MIRVFLIVFILIGGCTIIKKEPAKVIKAVRTTGHGSAFQVSHGGKTYMITAAHVCNSSPDMVIGKKLYKVHRLNVMDDVCVLTGPRRFDMVSFKLSPKVADAATEVKYAGFPMNSMRKKALIRNGLTGVRSMMNFNGEMVRIQHLFALIIGGTSGGPVYVDDTVYGAVIIGDSSSIGQMVPSPLIIKTIEGLQTKKACKMPIMQGNVPSFILYDMMIPGCIRKSGSCVTEIYERGPLNYHVICGDDRITP